MTKPDDPAIALACRLILRICSLLLNYSEVHLFRSVAKSRIVVVLILFLASYVMPICSQDSGEPDTYEEPATDLRQPEGIFAVAWSPDGTMIAGGGTDGFLRIWNADSGDTFIDFPGLTTTVLSISWSPDSTKIVSSQESGRVVVWNVSDPAYLPGQLIVDLSGHPNQVLRVAWSPDGTKIASVSFGGIDNLKIWDTSDYTLAASFTAGDIFGLEWSLDSTKLTLAHSDTGAYVVDISPNAIGTNVNIPIGVREPTASIAWNSDGSLLASGEFYKGIIHIWDAAGNPIAIFEDHTNGISALAWGPDDQLLASASPDGTIRIWDTVTMSPIPLEIIQKGNVYTQSIAWSPDGSKIAYGGAASNGQGNNVLIALAPLPNTCSLTIPAADTPALLSAITSANGAPETDTICLEAGTYTLDAPITSDITLVGLGAGAEIIGSLQVSGAGRITLRNVTVNP
jgi:WD40 repeat protein